MQEEVTQKVVALSVKAAKIDAALLQKSMKLLLRQIEKQRGKPKQGKQTLRQLKKHGAKLSNIEITDENIGAFSKTAKEFKVDFALKRDNTRTPPHYYVFFKAKDIDSITSAFQKFSREKLLRDKKPSIRQTLAAAKEQAKQLNAGRETVKRMERGQSL